MEYNNQNHWDGEKSGEVSQHDEAGNCSRSESDQGSQNDYSPIFSPRIDPVIQYRSRPFVYQRAKLDKPVQTEIAKQHVQQNQEKQSQWQQHEHEQSPQQQQQQSQQEDSFMLSSAHNSKRLNEMNVKEVESQHDILLPDEGRKSELDVSMSVVSQSSSRESSAGEFSPKSQVSSNSNPINPQQSSSSAQQLAPGTQQSSVQMNHKFYKSAICHEQFHSSSRQIVSVNGTSEQDDNERKWQEDEVVYTYNFQTQTQKDILRQRENDVKNVGVKSVTVLREEHEEEDKVIPSLKIVNVSPNVKGNQDVEDNYSEISFSPQDESTHKIRTDPYNKYRQRADNSPIVEINGNNNNFSAEELYNGSRQQSPHSSSQRQYNHMEYNDNNEENLQKSMQRIDQLRSQLLKSTENNINAIFTTKLSAEECQLAEMFEKVNRKVGDVCGKVEMLERKRVEEMEREVERRRRESEVRRQREWEKKREWENQRERERQRQRERKQQREFERQLQRDNRRADSRNGNMILDLGRVSANEGKIIAIYPNNQMVNVKELMFPHQESNHHQQAMHPKPVQQTDPTLKLMLETQQAFISTLQSLQAQINTSISSKLEQAKNIQSTSSVRQPKRRQYLDQQDFLVQQQKLQRVSQQTSDRENQEYDDSRGSINVMYIRKLRELEQDVKQKKWKIERLERDNCLMERQLEKVQQLGFKRKDESERRREVVSPLRHAGLGDKHLDFYNTSPLSPLQTYGQQHDTTLSFSPRFHQPTYNNPSLSSSSAHQQQRIKQPLNITGEQLEHFHASNLQSKKKNTHSFHHYESKAIQLTELTELREKLAQCELVLKEKDLRIRELENTVMDFLQSSKKWKAERESMSSKSNSSVGGYSSVGSQEQSVEVLGMKINNLKTLLKEAKRQCEKYKKLYEGQLSTGATTISHQNIRLEKAKLTVDDITSNTSRSMCVSDKTTIRHERQLNVHAGNNSSSPFTEITAQHYKNHASESQRETVFQSLINTESVTLNNLTQTLVNFVLMAWSLKEVIMKLCGEEVNVEKINKNARQFFVELRGKDVTVWRKVLEKLVASGGDGRLREIWVE